MRRKRFSFKINEYNIEDSKISSLSKIFKNSKNQNLNQLIIKEKRGEHAWCLVV